MHTGIRKNKIKWKNSDKLNPRYEKGFIETVNKFDFSNKNQWEI